MCAQIPVSFKNEIVTANPYGVQIIKMDYEMRPKKQAELFKKEINRNIQGS